MACWYTASTEFGCSVSLKQMHKTAVAEAGDWRMEDRKAEKRTPMKKHVQKTNHGLHSFVSTLVNSSVWSAPAQCNALGTASFLPLDRS